MFSRYTYNGDRGRWNQLSEAELAALTPAQMEEKHMLFSTVLAVDEEQDPHVYRGPFYIDIDAKDIASAIKVIQDVVGKLVQNQVDPEAIKVWASGKKGFHLVISSIVFDDHAESADLPHIYRHMATQLATDARLIDKTVYSKGRGRMWRVENIKRPDNGKYKVPLLIEEVMALTPEGYDAITSEPREFEYLPDDQLKKSPWLHILYEQAKFQAAQQPALKPMFIDPEVEEKMHGTTPACMKNLLAGENTKPKSGFNAVSLQMAKAIAYFAPQQRKELAEEFAKNMTGDTYNTVDKRLRHVNTALNQTMKTSSYSFNCGTMRSVLDKIPCHGCPLYEAETKESSASRIVATDGEDMALAGLEVTNLGYCFVGLKGERRLVSNFTLKFDKEYLELSQSTREPRRVALVARVLMRGETVGTVQIEETQWTSKAAFLSAFLGISHAAFYGTDHDIQKMKGALLSGENGMEKIVRVHTCGVLRTKVGDENIFAYTEPGWSIDSLGEEGRYLVSGKIPVAPDLHNVGDLEFGDQNVFKVMTALAGINNDLVVGLVLGWYSACFIKPHFEAISRQFPLLGLHGNAGAGKTVTAAIMAELHGVDYILEEGPVTLSTVTMFAIWSFIGSSTSVPRLLDEYNRSKMAKHKYNEISEVLKGVWSSQSVSRGTISGGKSIHGAGRTGAHTVEIPLSGPVVYMSEQAPEMPALVDRSVSVAMSREGRNNPAMTANLDYVHDNREALRPLARFLNMKALTTDAADVRLIMNQFHDRLPLSIGDRPHYSYKVVLTGLRFLKSALIEKGIDLQKRLDQLEDAVISHVAENEEDVVMQKRRSEVDHVIGKMAVMAALTEAGGQEWLVAGKHYVMTKGDTLFLDSAVAHAVYLRYMNTVERNSPAIESVVQFKTLLAQEMYCEDIAISISDFANGRKVAKLNVEKMTLKGIDTALFIRS